MTPEVSVIICTYNRADYLASTLKTFTNQTIEAHRFELILVDNNSDDQTEKVCQDFESGNSNLQISYFKETNQGLSYARNRGIKEAKAELLSFVDDDVFVPADYIHQLLLIFQEENPIAIGGRVIPYYESGMAPKWMSHFLLPTVSALNLGRNKKNFNGSKFPIGANMAFHRSVFEKYGDFNTELGRSGQKLEGGEEKDLFNRLKVNNESIVYAPDVSLQHVIPAARLETAYVRGLAIGVGTSEIKRVRDKGLGTVLKKWSSEIIKIGATLILFLFYTLQFKFAAAMMLVKFRIWVLKGMLSS